MRAFDQGADGVLVLGCHIGECHYDTGNHRAAKRIPVLQTLLSFVGLETERLRLDWVSASEGERFSRIASEFTEKVRALGPVHWRVVQEKWQASAHQLKTSKKLIPYITNDCTAKAEALKQTARELLESGEVSVVIGHEVGPRGQTRPSFAYSPAEVERLVWNPECSHNLTTYLPQKLQQIGKETPQPVAVVVKPCDSKTINVMTTENQFQRNQVHVIGMVCDGMLGTDGNLQIRCVTCKEKVPVVYDTLIGEATSQYTPSPTSFLDDAIAELDQDSPAERMEFWLNQFDRCIRCYACRQACPLCNCPTCLYERDDSTYVGLGIELNEKRTFHLGRAYHLAGRCIGCNECERVCPMELPISLLNLKLVHLMEESFGHVAGVHAIPSPIVTVLAGELQEGGPNG
jgi:ferredoxin